MPIVLERIEKAAIRLPETGEVFVGYRHNVIGTSMLNERRCSRPFPSGAAQGFVTSTGRFVDRTEALSIARAAGQTSKKEGRLFSEDLWTVDGTPIKTKRK